MQFQLRTLKTLPPDFEILVQDSRSERFHFLYKMNEDWKGKKNTFNKPGEILLGSFYEDKLVGVCGRNIDPYTNDTRIGRIRHLYVLPTYRKHGVGRSLVENIISDANKYFEKLRLRTSNPEAAAFYEKLGFSKSNQPEETHFLDLIKMSFNIQPMTTEEIRKVNVNELKSHNGQILLEDYNFEWPNEFLKHKAKIEEALYQLKIKVHHVGSTSVPSLAAKPIIDIVLEVPDSSNEASYVPALEDHGYKLHIKEPEWWEHRMFKSTGFPANLHVFTEGCLEVRRMLSFRDHLRSNKSDLELYQSKKRELANKHWEYVQNYADAKTEIIKDIFSRINV